MPRLTEQEQQGIVRYIEADRPLPDKYRFLLFEDKREKRSFEGNILQRQKVIPCLKVNKLTASHYCPRVPLS